MTDKCLYGLILAGGFSQRMGQDKALLDFHGKPQIEYVHDLLTTCCAKVFLSKRPNQQAYPAFPAIDDDPQFGAGGPLTGILSAMKAYPGISWLVMACDLPFVTQETLNVLIAKRDQKLFATAFISSHDGLPEPLCAVWEAGSYAQMAKSLQEGICCPRKILIQHNTCMIEQKDPGWLDNVNTVLEFQEARNKIWTNV